MRRSRRVRGAPPPSRRDCGAVPAGCLPENSGGSASRMFFSRCAIQLPKAPRISKSLALAACCAMSFQRSRMPRRRDSIRARRKSSHEGPSLPSASSMRGAAVRISAAVWAREVAAWTAAACAFSLTFCTSDRLRTNLSLKAPRPESLRSGSSGFWSPLTKLNRWPREREARGAGPSLRSSHF